VLLISEELKPHVEIWYKSTGEDVITTSLGHFSPAAAFSFSFNKREKSTLRQIPAPPDHFAQVEVIFVSEKKEHSANVTGILANTNFELTFAPRRAISS
jgi:hypothetical protein